MKFIRKSLSDCLPVKVTIETLTELVEVNKAEMNSLRSNMANLQNSLNDVHPEVQNNTKYLDEIKKLPEIDREGLK